MPCIPCHPKLQPALWRAGLAAIRNPRRAQGGCAPVVCPSWEVIGGGMEHTDLLAPPWAGCLLTCCQHRQCLCWSLPGLCSALPCQGQWIFFFPVPILEEGSGVEFAMFSSSPHDLDRSAPRTPLPVNIPVRLRAVLWGFPAMPGQGWGCPSLALGSCWALWHHRGCLSIPWATGPAGTASRWGGGAACLARSQATIKQSDVEN